MSDQIERCIQCDEPTERAGRSEDSLYTDDGKGPFCETCFFKISCYECGSEDFDEDGVCNNIRVVVVRIEGGKVRLGIEAPDHVEILREELRDEPERIADAFLPVDPNEEE